MSASNAQSKNFRIDVSEDRLVATLHIPAGAQAGASEIVEAVRGLNIKRFHEKQIRQALERRGAAAIEMEIARGTAPTQDQAGKAHVPVPADPAAVIRIVEAGDVLAMLTPGAAGAPGKDLFGEPIAPAATPPLVTPGRGVEIRGTDVVASVRGSLHWRGRAVSVDPLLEVADDVPAAIDFDGDVHVVRDLADGRGVQASGSLVVDGNVGAAKVRVRGLMHVAGSLAGDGTGRFTAIRGLACQSITRANVTTLGDVLVRGDVSGSLIFCGRAVRVADGAIAGGRIVANGGVACATLGSADGAPVTIEAGTDAMVAALLAAPFAEVEAHRKRARELRAASEPLMVQMKQLSHKEKEQATEFLAEASEAEETADRTEKRLKTQVDQLRQRECAEVTVTGVVHAGVKIRIGTAEVTIAAPLQGPLKVTATKNGLAENISIVDANGQRIPLPAAAKLDAPAAVAA